MGSPSSQHPATRMKSAFQIPSPLPNVHCETKPNAVLLYSHDLSYAFTKTTEFLASACQRLGVPAVLRDSFDPRAICLGCEVLDDPTLRFQAEKDIAERTNRLIDDFGVDCVLALDLGWFFLPDYFQNHSAIKKIYSIWYDEFHSWCRTKTNAIFPYRQRNFLENVAHPKILHCFYGEAMSREAKLMGFFNQISSKLAAPREYLTMNFPCEVTDKLAFIGNPGFREAPPKELLEHIEKGLELRDLRSFSRSQVLYSVDQGIWPWIKEEPTIKNLVAFATEMKIQSPFISSLEIIEMCSKAFPVAFECLNEKGNILNIAWLVKLVNRYDRPALVYRLAKKGLVEVISNQEEWQPYGIEAKPSIFADEMPTQYMRYIAHVNAANPLRDATANEKLFEIAACGRTAINLDSFDVRDCYGDEEFCFVQSLEEAEDMARTLIAHPERALNMGKKARRRTAREHTWDHRLANLFQNHFNPIHSIQPSCPISSSSPTTPSA
ncbi:MAG: glycosyltransferase [Verrucomicrobiota bacterium]